MKVTLSETIRVRGHNYLVFRGWGNLKQDAAISVVHDEACSCKQKEEKK